MGAGSGRNDIFLHRRKIKRCSSLEGHHGEVTEVHCRGNKDLLISITCHTTRRITRRTFITHSTNLHDRWRVALRPEAQSASGAATGWD